MINAKKIYNTLLNNSRITALVNENDILSSWPGEEIETFPCIIFMDNNQSDDEYNDNKAAASSCSVQIHIFTKKLEGFASTSEIGKVVAEVFNEDLWHCSQNGEVADPDPDAEHRVMSFNKSIFN